MLTMNIAGTQNARRDITIGGEQPGLCGQRQCTIITQQALSHIVIIIESRQFCYEVSLKAMSDGDSTL